MFVVFKNQECQNPYGAFQAVNPVLESKMCPLSVHPRTDGTEWSQLCKAIIIYLLFECLCLHYFPKAMILLIANRNSGLILALRFLTFFGDRTGIIVPCLLQSRLWHYCLCYSSFLISFLFWSLLSQKKIPEVLGPKAAMTCLVVL